MILSKRDRNILASCLKVMSFILYAWNDALSKQLTTQTGSAMSALDVIFHQYCITAFFLAPIVLARKSNFSQSIVAPHYHLLRVILCTIGILLLNQSFSKMPLAYATSLNLLSPFITMIFAVVVFRERLSSEKIKALLLSIATYLVLMATQHDSPEQALSVVECLKPTIALLCFQANTLITKKLTALRENNINLTVVLFMCIPVVLLPFEIQHLTVLPLHKYAVLTLMAVNGVIATLALHQSIAMADLTFLLPFGFLKYGILSFFGYLYFREIPSIHHTIGIALAVASILYLHQSSGRKKHGIVVAISQD